MRPVRPRPLPSSFPIYYSQIVPIYWILKEEALDRSLWRTRFGRGDGHVVRKTTESMNPTKKVRQAVTLLPCIGSYRAAISAEAPTVLTRWSVVFCGPFRWIPDVTYNKHAPSSLKTCFYKVQKLLLWTSSLSVSDVVSVAKPFVGFPRNFVQVGTQNCSIKCKFRENRLSDIRKGAGDVLPIFSTFLVWFAWNSLRTLSSSCEFRGNWRWRHAVLEGVN